MSVRRIVTGLAGVLAALLVCMRASAQDAPEVASGWDEKRAVTAGRYMVVAAHPLAADAGMVVLARGGTAVDAAIAVQMVLNLVEPQSSGIGGGGFLLHWTAGEKAVEAYDGREAAPIAARPDRFQDASGRALPFRAMRASALAVGVPGTLRMLFDAHRRHGRLPWASLFEPAIRAAERGFPMSHRLHVLLAADERLRRTPAARALYYSADGAPKPEGSLIVNRELAATLRLIARRGPDAFYFGAIAEDIVAAVRAHETAGDLSVVDLARYRAVRREAVCAPYREYRVCGMPPPSSGGIGVLQILGILERSAFSAAGPHTVEALHLFAEAGRLAYADRGQFVADPDFVAQPVAGLLDPSYLTGRAKLLGDRSIGHAPPGRPAGAPVLASAPENPLHGTTHVTVVDARGNAVSMTTSIEDAFGSRIQVRGFLLNNQLTDFSFLPEVGGLPVANRVEPGKRPRSSMSPTLVFDRDGRLRLAIGSPGGPAIINFVARAIVANLDWGFDIQTAIALPNLGSRNGPTDIEAGSLYVLQADALRARGHEVRMADQTSGLHGIERTARGWRGGADPRREGVVRGR